MKILLAAALLAASASTAIADPCNQGQLTGKWLLTSIHGNGCTITVAADGSYAGTCTGPDWQRRGGPVEGSLKIRRTCLIAGQISGEARNGTFGPLAIGPAALSQDGLIANGLQKTGDGDQRHLFNLTKLP